MKRVKEFLQDNWDGKNPLLVGCSGGPDSKALLYAFLEAGCKELHVAHVDHGWREESREEARLLKEEVSGLGLPFHTVRFAPSSEKNKEASARISRFSFFRSLFEKNSFQALVLGHQADDLAETALKRLFEGAHLPFLGGMEPTSNFEGLSVWRPLLRVRKEEIIRFLEKRKINYFIDYTNKDPVYQRSRFREEMFPFLNRSFGKDVQNNLVHLSERAYELQRYLDRKIEGRQVVHGEWGWAIFCGDLERVEARYLIQKKATEVGLVLSRTVLEPLLDWLKNPNADRKIGISSMWAICRSGWVLFLNEGKALPEKGWIRKLVISLGATRS